MPLGLGLIDALAQIRISANLIENLPARAARENLSQICLCARSARKFVANMPVSIHSPCPHPHCTQRAGSVPGERSPHHASPRTATELGAHVTHHVTRAHTLSSIAAAHSDAISVQARPRAYTPLSRTQLPTQPPGRAAPPTKPPSSGPPPPPTRNTDTDRPLPPVRITCPDDAAHALVPLLRSRGKPLRCSARPRAPPHLQAQDRLSGLARSRRCRSGEGQASAAHSSGSCPSHRIFQTHPTLRLL